MFKLHKSDVCDTTPFLFYSGTPNEVFSMGQAVVLSGGLLTKCAATASPDFICVCDVSATASHQRIPVYAISSRMEFETVPAVSIPASAVGSKVTLDSTATTITATATAGVFKITYSENVANTPVLGRF